MSKPTVGIFGLTGCAGDQLAILNCEDQLLDLVALIDIREFLMASSENDTECTLDVALVEGAVVSEKDAARLDDRQTNAHQLSAVQAMRLLQLMTPVRFTLLGVSIRSATAGNKLSRAVEAQMPAILDRVLEELGWNSSK
jgi:Ni,Fe-hydrogenase maturation factor